MTMRRPVLPLLLLLAACGPKAEPGATADSAAAAAPAPLPPGDLAYVTNEDSQELSIIHTGLDSVIATLNVGTRPRGVVISADGQRVFVALSGSPKCPPSMPAEECEKLQADKSKDGIAVVNTATRSVERVLPGGSDPETFDLSADGTRLFVSNEDAGVATIVNVGTGAIEATVKVGREPEGAKVQPDGQRVWVTGETDHDVTVLDAATGRKVGRVVVGERPRGIAFTPDNTLGFVTSEFAGAVSVVDVATLKIRKTLTLTIDKSDTTAKPKKPMGVAVSPDGGTVYVSTGRGGTVDIIDVASLTVTGSIKAGARPWGVALTADGGKLYTANGPSNDVSVIDTKTRSVVKTIPVGKVPWGVAIAGTRTVAAPTAPAAPAAAPAAPAATPAAPAPATPGRTGAVATAPTAPAPTPAPAAGGVDWGAYEKQAREVPRDTIPAEAYAGWKQYELNCSRCHGEFGVGSSFAPSLVASLKDDGTVPDQGAFITVVCQGRKEKGMPSWCEAGLEPDKMLNMYAYLKLRADGKVGAGRPAVRPG